MRFCKTPCSTVPRDVPLVLQRTMERSVDVPMPKDVPQAVQGVEVVSLVPQ